MIFKKNKINTYNILKEFIEKYKLSCLYEPLSYIIDNCTKKNNIINKNLSIFLDFLPLNENIFLKNNLIYIKYYYNNDPIDYIIPNFCDICDTFIKKIIRKKNYVIFILDFNTKTKKILGIPLSRFDNQLYARNGISRIILDKEIIENYS